MSNAIGQHTISCRTNRSISGQRNLGGQMHSILKVATQVERVVQKSNGMRVLIDQGTEYKNDQSYWATVYKFG